MPSCCSCCSSPACWFCHVCKKPYCNAHFDQVHGSTFHKRSVFKEKSQLLASHSRMNPDSPHRSPSKPHQNYQVNSLTPSALIPVSSTQIPMNPVIPLSGSGSSGFVAVVQFVQACSTQGSPVKPKPLRKICDVLFLIDSTGSMSSCITAAHEKAEKIAENFKKQYKDIKFRFGAVCYRDPIDCREDKHEISQLNTDIKLLSTFLGKVKATGGGDGPEDIAGAFECALDKIKWKHGPKNIILITDSPAHGKKFCGYKNHEEETERLINVLKRTAKQGIFISAISINGGSNLPGCFKEMKAIYDRNLGKIKSTFTIESFETADTKKIPIEKQIGKKLKEVSKNLVTSSITVYYAAAYSYGKVGAKPASLGPMNTTAPPSFYPNTRPGYIANAPAKTSYPRKSYKPNGIGHAPKKSPSVI